MKLKTKAVSVIFPDGGYIRISNYIKIIDKEHMV